MKDHETFMQKLIALGGAINYYRHRCPAHEICNHKICLDIINDSDRIISELRLMSRWKKWILNKLIV